MFAVDRLILVGGVLLLFAITSSKFSSRIGVPVLGLFLGVGMLRGSERIGGIAFENHELAHGVGTLALAVILFDGGLRPRGRGRAGRGGGGPRVRSGRPTRGSGRISAWWVRPGRKGRRGERSASEDTR